MKYPSKPTKETTQSVGNRLKKHNMYKAPSERVTGFFQPVKEVAKKVGNKVVDVVSDIIIAPKTMRTGMQMRQSDKDVAALKAARGTENAPKFNDDGTPSDAFKALTLAEDVRTRLNKKNK